MRRHSMIVAFSTPEDDCKHFTDLRDEVEHHNAAVRGHAPSSVGTLNQQGRAYYPIALVGTDCTFRSRYLLRRLSVIDGMIAVAEGLGDLTDPDRRSHTLNVLLALETGVRVAVVGELAGCATVLLGEQGKGLQRRWKHAESCLDALEFTSKLEPFDERPAQLPEDVAFVTSDAVSFHRVSINNLPIYPEPPKPLGSETWCNEWASAHSCFLRSGLLAAIVDALAAGQDVSLGPRMRAFLETNAGALELMAGSEAVRDREAAISTAVSSLANEDCLLLTDDYSTDEIQLKKALLSLLGWLIHEDDVEVVMSENRFSSPRADFGFEFDLADSAAPQKQVTREKNQSRITISRTSADAMSGKLHLTKSDLAPLYGIINEAQAIVSQKVGEIIR
ncbi:MAG: hypothetical protein AAGJ91_04545 [Pseudomonadota bacterium]